MVNFNLRGDCIGRTDTDFRRGMTDKRFLELEITAWLRSPERKRQLAGEMYYDNQQDILAKRRMAIDDNGDPIEVRHLPNNRLISNQYAKMVDQKTNYSFGRPFHLTRRIRAMRRRFPRYLAPFPTGNAKSGRRSLDWGQKLALPVL